MDSEKTSHKNKLNGKTCIVVAALFVIAFLLFFVSMSDGSGADPSTEDGLHFVTNADTIVPERSITYSGATVTVMSDGEGYSITGNTGTAAGDYLAVAKLDDPLNTTWPDGTTEDKEINWSISKAPLTVVASDMTINVGDEIPNFTFFCYGLMPGDDILSIGGDAVFNCIYSPISTTGNYAISVSGLTSSNYEISYVDGTLTVSPVIIEIPMPQTNFVYDKREKIGVQNSDNYEIAGDSIGTNAGEYTSIVSLTDIINTKWSDGTIESKTINWNIQKAPLKVTAENKNIMAGDEVPLFTHSFFGFISGDNISSIGGTARYDCGYNTQSPIGEYTIYVSGLTSNNYEISFVEGTLSVSKRDIQIPVVTTGLVYCGMGRTGIHGGEGYIITGTSSETNAGNYESTVILIDSVNTIWSDGTSGPKTLNWEIKKAPLSIKVDDQNIVAGGSVSQFTLSYRGFVPGDNQSVIEGEVVFECEYKSQIGSFSVCAHGLYSNNYDITFECGTLTVSAIIITIPMADTEVIYIGTKQTGIQNGDGYTLTGETSGTNAGHYVATAKLIDNVNSIWSDGTVADKTIDWMISKAVLRVAYSGDNVIYGTSPALSMSVSGFVPGESQDNASGYSPPHLSNGNTNAGTYVLTPSGGSADNYDFEYMSGTLLISKKVIQIPVAKTGLIYNGSEQIGISGGEGYMLSGNIASDAGNYIALAALTDAEITSWPDGDTGQEEVQWSIAPKSLNNAMVSAPDQVYTGGRLEPVNVIDGGQILVKGTDYQISYANNVEAGQAAAAVMGIGNYAGTVPVAFKIAKNCLISFSLSGFSGIAPASKTILSGSLLDLDSVAGPSRAGYGFRGWSSTPGGEAMSGYTVVSDATLYAAWNLNIYDEMPFDEIDEIISQNQKPVVQIRKISAGDHLENSFFERLSGKGKPFTVNIIGDNGKMAYSWYFNGDYNPGAGTFTLRIMEMDPNFDLELLVDSSEHENPLVLDFAADGLLPMGAIVTYCLGDSYPDGKTLSVFFYDEDTNELKETQKVKVTDGSVTFGITHCSKYVIAEEIASVGTLGADAAPYIVAALVAIAAIEVLAIYLFLIRRN